MDSILHIKDNLISRIKSSNDLDFLKALQTIFDSAEQELYKLTPEQEKSIELGRQDILSGNFRSHEQVMKETKEWLEKL